MSGQVRDRPRVGISACLLGWQVRYNGADELDRSLTRALGGTVEWVPVCPEVEAGLGVPRETIRLVAAGPGGGVRAVTGVTDRDVTDALVACADRRVEELAALGLDGYVLKSGSPSCGIAAVKVRHGGEVRRTGQGLFAATLSRRLPDLPIDDEAGLTDPDRGAEFAARVVAHHHRRRSLAAGP